VRGEGARAEDRTLDDADSCEGGWLGHGWDLPIDQRFLTDRQILGGVPIPSFAKKFIKPRNTVVSIDDWNDFGDGTFGGTFTLDTHGVPVDIKGQTLLVANGDDKSDYTVTIDIKVSVPLIGGKLENFSKGIVNAQMDEEFRLGDAWLAEH
jgi:hypothetical protein